MTMNADQVTSAAAGAAAAGGAAWLSTLGDVAVQLLGVPLPVVVAAIAGALLARVYLPAIAFGAALGRAAVWVVTGCVSAQGLSAIAMDKLALPVGVLGIAALLVSGLGPKLWPVLVENAPLILKRWLRRLSGNESGGNTPGGTS